MMLSTRDVILRLKAKKLLPEYYSEWMALPPDPDKRLILVHIEPRYVVNSSRDYKHIKEICMNYYDMVAAVKEGAHARRPTWKPSEQLWSDGKILIHNTPYFGEPFNQAIQGYVYVCEQVDVVANDWELLAV